MGGIDFVLHHCSLFRESFKNEVSVTMIDRLPQALDEALDEALDNLAGRWIGNSQVAASVAAAQQRQQQEQQQQDDKK